MMHTVQIIFISVVFSYLAQCARIFGVFHIPSISHIEVYQPLYKQLSLRGHQVTVVTPNPLQQSSLSNLTEIDVGYLYNESSFIKNEMGANYLSTMFKVNKWMEFLVELILQDKRVIEIYTNTRVKFDLVLVEHYTPMLHIFGIIFKAPVIGLTSADAFMGTHIALGNPVHPNLFSDGFLPISEQSLNQKIWRSLCFLWSKLHYEFVIYPRCNRIAKKYFGNDLMDLRKAESETSLLLINTNYFINPIRPITPNVVTLGFMHLKSGILSADLQKIMDKATEGVIYMSLGSNVKSSTLPQKLIRTIIKTLSNLPYTVLWKWEAGNISDIVGNNVITRKWFPQQDVLAHPHIKVFVTQGGLQSIEEAISNGVPMIAIPFVADQASNVNRLTKLGIGLKLDSKSLTEEKLSDAILKVANNSEYLKNIKKIRDVALDQPMTSLEKAVWWTEYVIRHRGAKHLRSAIADTPLWEYLMLDVISVVLTCFLVCIYFGYRILGLIVGLVKSLSVVKIKLS